MSLDLLIVTPCLDWEDAEKKRMAMRIEESIPNQESPPIGAAYIMAMVEQHGFSARYLNMAVERCGTRDLLAIIETTRPAVVGFHAYTVLVKAAAEVARSVKEAFPGIVTCLGGPHATSMGKTALSEFPCFDFVARGEAEDIMLKVLSCLSSGDALPKAPGLLTSVSDDAAIASVSDLDALPFPAWNKFDLSLYPGFYPHGARLELPVCTSRGCPFRCVFCAGALGKKRRQRSVASVISEIEHNMEAFGCDAVVFTDETFITSLQWAHDLFAQMLQRGIAQKIRWSCEMRVNSASQELYRAMKKAGCCNIFFGLESGDDDMLKHMGKNTTVEQNRRAIRWAKEAGIVPMGSFIIGLPGENEETMRKTLALAKELDLYSVTFPIAVPFPGTELRDMAMRGECGMRILSNNWDDYGKQYPGVMESNDLSIERRRALQTQAYAENPKKTLSDYVKKLPRGAQDDLCGTAP